jgi:1-acyl-sn-glycerol-3-phosphate acyltransferase
MTDDGSEGDRTARRPPPARVSPEALAAQRGGAREGLAWLGHAPRSHGPLLYHLLRLVARFTCFVLLRFRIRAEGRSLLPAGGGYLVVAAAHRGWMDPFVVMHALPAEPRSWFLGSGPSTFTAPWREWLIRRVGGLLPVWRGGIGVDQHVASARAVLDAGGVFVQMPEGTVSGPPGRVGVLRTGWAIIAIRTDARIVPMAIAGTEELYIGRRLASRLVSPTTIRELAALPSDAPLPEPGSRAELELARRATDALAAILGPGVEEIHPWTVDPPDRPRRLRRRLTGLLLGPGRVDRS